MKQREEELLGLPKWILQIEIKPLSGQLTDFGVDKSLLQEVFLVSDCVHGWIFVDFSWAGRGINPSFASR